MTGAAGKAAARGDNRKQLIEQLRTYEESQWTDQRASELLQADAAKRARAERPGLTLPPLKGGWYIECTPLAMTTTERQRYFGEFVEEELLEQIDAIRMGRWRAVQQFTVDDAWSWEDCGDRIRGPRADPNLDYDGEPFLETYAMSMPPPMIGGCDLVLMALFAVSAARGWLLIQSQRGDLRHTQKIKTRKDAFGTWSFICPVTGKLAPTLLPRNGRWASPEAQHLHFDASGHDPKAYPGVVRRWYRKPPPPPSNRVLHVRAG